MLMATSRLWGIRDHDDAGLATPPVRDRDAGGSGTVLPVGTDAPHRHTRESGYPERPMPRLLEPWTLPSRERQKRRAEALCLICTSKLFGCIVYIFAKYSRRVSGTNAKSVSLP